MNKFQTLVNTPSDINQHLEILKKYSSECDSVCEFGIREIVSTWAVIDGLKPGTKYTGIDLYESNNLKDVADYAKTKDIDFTFKEISTLSNELTVECDFLFIDTLHTYEQVSQELTKHGNSPSKYLGFHDVVTFAYRDEVPTNNPITGLLPGIFKFMIDNPHWSIDYFAEYNNGLMILKRKASMVKR
jgi:hypothetical protein